MEYFVEAGGSPALAESEALGLWRRAREGGGGAERGRLAENFAPMVAAEAARVAGTENPEPFAAWGNLGLLRAFCSYRPGSPIGFYEYCRRRVCETMLAEARVDSAGGGIAGAAEVARLWGELRRVG